MPLCSKGHTSTLLIRGQGKGFPGGSDGKESTCNVRDPGSIPGSGRCIGEGNGYSLQYSCLENSWTEQLGELQSMGLLRVGQDWVTNTLLKGSPRKIKMFEQSTPPLSVSSPQPPCWRCVYVAMRISSVISTDTLQGSPGVKRLTFQIRSWYLRVLVSPSVKWEQWAFHLFLRVVKRIDWSYNKHEESGILLGRVRT